MPSKKTLRVLTWHVHGNYLWYLSETPCDFILPVANSAVELGHGYSGRGTTFPFGSNVIDCPIEQLRNEKFDLILFQSRKHYEEDQHQILSPAQRRLPSVYIEHDPPWEDVTDQPHWFRETNGLLIHVTHYNHLMWQCDHVPSRVIEHGVKVPPTAAFTGELSRGITALNHLTRRGRKVGADIFQQLAAQTPLDLVGMAAEEAGGLGEVVPTQLAHFIARYRYFFSPIRYTSLGLAILEAMMVGLPILGLATCELATVIENGKSGYLETDLSKLLAHMQRLSDDRQEAYALGQEARRIAMERFNIQRFASDWYKTLTEVAGPRSFGSMPARKLSRSALPPTSSLNPQR